MQESNIQIVIWVNDSTLTLRLASVVKDVQEMKTSLQYTQKDVESLFILIK